MDGAVIGTVGISCVARKEKARHRAEFGVSVDKAYWGLGIGRALTEACIECAKNAGYVQLELEAVAENDNALALYRSVGFTEYGRNPKGFRSRLCGWQERFVSHPIRSLAQAYVYRDQCQPFGICAEGKMVGYVMVIYDYDVPEYDIWHMMIDESAQGHGYGNASLDRVIEYIRAKPFGSSGRVALTCNKGNTFARKLNRPVQTLDDSSCRQSVDSLSGKNGNDRKSSHFCGIERKERTPIPSSQSPHACRNITA